MPIVWNENKPPLYFCDDCQKEVTHYNNEMVLLKEELWLSIAQKKDVLCFSCIQLKLKRGIVLSDLKLNVDGEHCFFNMWLVDKIKQQNKI